VVGWLWKLVEVVAEIIRVIVVVIRELEHHLLFFPILIA
jgi:hypothetical protein